MQSVYGLRWTVDGKKLIEIDIIKQVRLIAFAVNLAP